MNASIEKTKRTFEKSLDYLSWCIDYNEDDEETVEDCAYCEDFIDIAKECLESLADAARMYFDASSDTSEIDLLMALAVTAESKINAPELYEDVYDVSLTKYYGTIKGCDSYDFTDIGSRLETFINDLVSIEWDDINDA